MTATTAAGPATAGGPDGGGSTRGRGRVLFWLALPAVIVALVLVAGAPAPSIPLSPRSTAPEGTRGLVLFLEELGASVELSRGASEPADDVVLILSDDLGDDRREEVRSWVREGGTLVVADPGSPLAAAAGADEGTAGFDFGLTDRGSCDIDALAGAELITLAGTFTFDAPTSTFAVVDGAESCFGDGNRAVVVAQREGSGVIVSIGDPDLFMNDNLDADDNAVVAAALLAPDDGTAVRVLEAPFQVRDRTLTDLIPDNVVRAFAQVLLAFAIYALWRSRRLGRPVSETQPVEIAGSELVAAVGGLLEVSGAPYRAAEILRAELRRDLALRFGVAPDTPADVTAQIVAERTGTDPSRLYAALAPVPPATDADLAELARLIQSVRQEVISGHRA
ncbi:MAG: DUF4350 domain-containing protein [Acidimicrobiales bacterium]